MGRGRLTQASSLAPAATPTPEVRAPPQAFLLMRCSAAPPPQNAPATRRSLLIAPEGGHSVHGRGALHGGGSQDVGGPSHRGGSIHGGGSLRTGAALHPAAAVAPRGALRAAAIFGGARATPGRLPRLCAAALVPSLLPPGWASTRALCAGVGSCSGESLEDARGRAFLGGAQLRCAAPRDGTQPRLLGRRRRP